MKFLKNFFSRPEVTSNQNNASMARPNNINKNMELIQDKNFDLNGFLGDFDAKINFLYEKISKMEVKMLKKDEELRLLKEQINLGKYQNQEETSIVNTQKNNLNENEPVNL